MDNDLFRFGLTAFVTLFVVVDPLGGAPLFVGLLKSKERPVKRQTLTRAVFIAFGVAVSFLVAGKAVLSHLGVTVPAFAISGGVLLFVTALPMLFGQRPGLQAPENTERSTAGEDIAVFPLAIPLLSGPGTIASVLLLANQAGYEAARMGILFFAIVAVFALTWLVLQAGESLMERLGEGKMHILTRVLGILLAALAVQFVLNGISAYYRVLLAGG
ncbi:MAG: MarC family protein [Terriglobia bacterium]